MPERQVYTTAEVCAILDDPNSITRNYRRLADRLGWTTSHFHDLRATAISAWRKNGMALEVTAALAGHEQSQVTLDVYTDVDLDRKRAARGD